MDFPPRRDADGTAAVIAEGDLVIVYETFESVGYTYAKAGDIHNSKFGAFHHKDIIGKSFGSKVYSRCSRGYVHVLLPTPELWSQVLRHRTQIVQTLDIAMINFHLHLKPGSVVLESGTGSGSLSTSIARTIAPTGRLHTFEFNQHRADVGTEEFERNRLADIITLECRDVCAAGFPDALDGAADAVFLDLPSPWLAVAHAAKAMKPDARFCSYSPCMEQVQRTCLALEELGFHSIRTVEARLKTYEPKRVQMDVPRFEPKVGVAARGLRTRSYGRQAQKEGATGIAQEAAAASSDAAGADEGGGAAAVGEAVVKEEGEAPPASAGEGAGQEQKEGRGTKREREGGTDEQEGEAKEQEEQEEATREADPVPVVQLCARSYPTMRGHTAFLTFATSPIAGEAGAGGGAASEPSGGGADAGDASSSAAKGE